MIGGFVLGLIFETFASELVSGEMISVSVL